MSSSLSPRNAARGARRPARHRFATTAVPALLTATLLAAAACGSSEGGDGGGDRAGAPSSASQDGQGTIDGGSISTTAMGDLGSLNSGSAAGLGSGSAAARATGEVEVVRDLPHDPAAFTQGLEFHDGRLYESTGEYGTSWVSAKQLDAPATDYEFKTDSLPREQFGEGMTFVGNSLWQLTWKDGVAYQRDAATGEETDRADYEGEGWGLCNLGDRLAMSDGSNKITFRDPETFAPTGSVDVAQDGRPIDQLNELECAGGKIYANVWMSDTIVRIDPATGAVDAAWDLHDIGQPRPSDPNAVLNGIAAVPDSDTFVVTGKLWPGAYEVRLK
ncbi:glutaminyl-peptide cyclotransferase [Dietzia sp.]|uniref:glutaminyl-peptide cyclotransferase n=1 Tax=Dietzia sp. TaxID=1871616 RepID=UPI002FDA4919